MKKLLFLLISLSITLISYCPSSGENHRQRMSEVIMERLRQEAYEKQLNLFIKHLGYKESGNRSHVVNSIGCIGEYQFHPMTLKQLGYTHITPEKFKMDPSIFPPELQRQCLEQLITINSIYLNEYYHYIGTEIKGIEITKAGLLGGAHLGGVQSVKVFLTTNGIVDRMDLNGTSISDYIKEFSNYKL